MCQPQPGQHHDLFNLETSFGELCGLSEETQISLGGLFLTADSGFDAKGLHDDCFRRGTEANITSHLRSRLSKATADTCLDTELYRERTDAWLDSFPYYILYYLITSQIPWHSS